MKHRFRVSAAGTAVTALLLGACSSADGDSASPAAVAGYPFTLANCGRDVTVPAPPKRAVSLNQGTTEVLLSLGVADRLVGTATWTDPVLPALADANAKVPRLADNKPALETVLATEPDFVAASFISTLGPGGVATRDRFSDLGVGTYLAPSDCEGKTTEGSEDGARQTPATLDLVYKEITELARVFDVSGRGETLVGELRDKVTKAQASVPAKTTKTSAMFWFANAESPYLAGCCGAPGIIANTLGLRNVFDDTKDEWPQINWEVVAARNPDVLVLGDLTRKSQTAESGRAKIEFLESNPVTREMDAVKNRRYILVTGAEMNPSLRTVYGIENVAAGLRRLGLAG